MAVALLACAALLPGRARGQGTPRELSPEEAQKLLPRADLRGLSPSQLGALADVSSDTFDYAGCTSTLAACLRLDVKDKHAPRMAKLAALLLQDGLSQSQTIFYLERYYSGFDKAKRKKVDALDCPSLGDAKAPVPVVEFSDYQCPHCAVALKPLHDFVEASKGRARLCSKFFPLPGHPRARIAAACAEYARRKGKFWEMNEMLFAKQDELDDANLKSFAAALKLNGDEMLKDAYGGKFEPVIDKHLKEGAAAEVQATPSLFFGGRLNTLPVKLDYLLLSLEDELEWQRNGGAWDKE